MSDPVPVPNDDRPPTYSWGVCQNCFRQTDLTDRWSNNRLWRERLCDPCWAILESR